MKTQTIFIVLLLVFIFSCRQQKESPAALFFEPKVVELEGYTVPKEGLGEPKVVSVGKPRIVPAGNPKVLPVTSNVQPVGKPEVILAGIPRECTPGKDSFSLPMVIPVLGRVSIPGNPEMVVAGDPVTKDQNSYNFSSFGQLQGLISSAIFSILQDKNGNLWIGTYGGGVCKYDGVSFTHFTTKQGLGSNIVVSILEDKYGNLWFGTLGGGLIKYNGHSFTQFTEKEGLGSNFVRSLLEDKLGNIWIGTSDSGVTMYHPGDIPSGNRDSPIQQQDTTSRFTRFTTKEGLIDNRIWTLYEDKNGYLWFGTYAGVCKYDGRSFTHYSNKEGLTGTNVKAIVQDQNGNFWFGGWGLGVYKFDGKHFTHYTIKEGLSHNNVKTILEDKSGNLWFGTEGGGINLFESGKERKGIPATITQFTVREGLSSNNVQSLLEDKNGILWIGTNDNLNKFGGKAMVYFTEREGITGSIKSILETKNGNIWFGGSDGLGRYDGKSFLHFTRKEGMLQDNVNTILEDRNGHLWIGTYTGASRYDGKTFTHYTSNEVLGDVQSILEDRHGNLWFASYQRGVSRFDGKSFTQLTTREGLNSNWALDILQDTMENIWIASLDKGISKYKPSAKDHLFTHLLEKENVGLNSVHSLFEDRKGNIWLGTEGGVLTSYVPAEAIGPPQKPNLTSFKFTLYTKEEGLFSDFIWGIVEDKNNNLWISTSEGVHQLNRSYSQEFTDQIRLLGTPSYNYKTPMLFKSYHSADGFHGASFSNMIWADQNSSIWKGSKDRITVFRPELAISDTIPPHIQLAGLTLFNEIVYWPFLESKKDTSFVLGNGERIHDLRFNGVDKWYGIPQQLSLPYNINHLTFRYVGIATHSPKKIKYRYTLSGLDKNWKALTDRTKASYNNLAHGEYTFKVKAMNSEGYWSDELNYSFRIRPPWWLSTSAYIFYGLCLITGLFFTDRIQRKRVLEKERAKTKEREYEQAKEIEKAYIKLKDTQAQLIQSEKMASLGELTAGIAHEIQNPLNFVNNFSELNNEMLQEMKSEVDKGNFIEVKTIADSVIENELKINLHGKRAESIVKSMLQHSQKSSGVKEPADINALAEEYMRLSYHGLRAKDQSFQAELKMDLDPTLPLVNVIPQDIGRVLLNLFNNAFWACAERSLGTVGKRSKRQGVSLETHPVLEDYNPTVTLITKNLSDHIEIQIRDNGHGVPPQIIDKIFQPFFTTKPPGLGTGLGLSLAYEIITKVHGGTLEVKSAEGEGSVFIVGIPLRPS